MIKWNVVSSLIRDVNLALDKQVSSISRNQIDYVEPDATIDDLIRMQLYSDLDARKAKSWQITNG